MSNYTTGEMAKICNVSVRTVQYYDQRGILTPAELSEGGRRLYSEDDLSTMKVICFLRELGLSLDNIATLMNEENSGEVIDLILDGQRIQLEKEAAERREQIERIAQLRRHINKNKSFSVKSIGDVARIMKNKKSLKKIYATMLLTAIPVGVLQWAGIIMWITKGFWWLFAIWAVVAVPYAIFISKYYFNNVAYICPHCHEVFVPKFKEAFWANHTPKTRKLTCPKCSVKSFCLETLRENATAED